MGKNIKSVVVNSQPTKFKAVCLILLSACLLIFAFPKFDISFLAFIGLAPLLIILEHKSFIKAFFIAYICGILFFAGMIYWFFHVAHIGVVFMVLIWALYFGLFGVATAYFRNLNSMHKFIIIPAIWVACEFIRGSGPAAFDWCSLGHTQYKNLIFIQIADITGVGGISYIIVLVNVFIKDLFLREDKAILIKKGLCCFAIVITAIGYGWLRLNDSFGEKTIKVAAIQANTPQEIKWDERSWPVILQNYIQLSTIAYKERPDLIIWPETSFPGYLGEQERTLEQINSLVVQLKTPILLGAIAHSNEDYFNAAVLVSSAKIQQYNKTHLVPFGEYLPFRRKFPFLAEIVPIEDFSAGEKYTIFSLVPKSWNNKKEALFSVVICFEDSISNLSRNFVHKGSQLFINITNDAWFKDTKAPYLHLQSAVFRTIEYRRSMIRAANTGISGFIDPKGNIIDTIMDNSQDETFISGISSKEILLSDKITLYARFTEFFAYFCILCILMSVFMRKKSQNSNS